MEKEDLIREFDKFKEFLESPQGQEMINRWQKEQEFLDKWKNNYLEWFNSIGPEKRAYYIQKVIDKYSSDAYQDRWYKQGCFPPEELYFWIYDYAYKYGKCWHAIADEVGPGYDSKFRFDNWIVILYNGQGSVVIVRPVTEEDIKKGPDEWSQRWLGHEYEEINW